MKILVLAGGVNMERDVSLSTGNMIYRALRDRGHSCVLLDVYLGWEGDPTLSFERDWELTEAEAKVGIAEPNLDEVRNRRKGDKRSFFGPNVLPIALMADVVFLALHGQNGEDGKIQACFELMGIRYTGTDYFSSAIGLDKGLTKQIFTLHGIPTPTGYLLKKNEPDIRQSEIPFPKIVKINTGGSSVGVYLAHTMEEYEQAKQQAFTYDTQVVIEEYIAGREFDVGVLNQKAMPVIEIATDTGLYDYQGKYQPGGAVETCPAQISPAKTQELQLLAEKVFAALRMRGYARIDFRMDENETIYCLEANSLPGMTPTSLFPQEAAAMGIGFGELCEEIIRLSYQENEAL
ncbi:MAG: D-alanine--D-alanine ligase [Lachnospiraceae bacterium]|nr:D-alanine--D-alanine ligase [Lachnospiraceae bacterium]